MRLMFSALVLTLMACTAGAIEMAHPLGFPDPNGEIAEEVTDIYNFIYYICAVVFVGVQGVLLYAIWRFRRSKNPTPATFTHNTALEIVWTAIPAVICIIIAWKSFEGMKLIRTMPESGIVVEGIAYQFGWDFDYPDLKISAPEPENVHVQLSSAGEDRYVKEMVVPVNTNIKLNLTSKDVIHAFYVPDLGIKIDMIPGRINYQWFNAQQTGEFIGQCAELCGAAHGEMFFTVRVVEMPEYLAWVNAQRSENGLEAVAKVL